VLIATHDKRQIRRLQKRVLELREGEMIHDGGVASV
jgi:ABC-type ATPase involved in cell division